MRTSRLSAALVASALLLAGCGSDAEEPAGGSGESRSSETSSDGASAAGPVSAGGISFQPPEGWQVVGDEQGALGVGEAARRLGTDQQAVQKAVDNTELLMVDPDAEGEFGDNLNVRSLTGTMPTKKELRQQLGGIQGTVTDIQTTDTDAGETMVATYTMNGPVDAFGSEILVPVGEQVAILTMMTGDESRTLDLTDGVVSSLDAAQGGQ